MSETWVQITHPDIPNSLVTTTAANAKRKAEKGWEVVEPEAAAEAKDDTTKRSATLKKAAAKKAPAKKKS